MEDKNPEEKQEGATDGVIEDPSYSYDLNEFIVIDETEKTLEPVVAQKIINDQPPKTVESKNIKELNKPTIPVSILFESLWDTTSDLQLDANDFSLLLDDTLPPESPKTENDNVNDKLDSLIITTDEKELENEMVQAVKIEEPNVQVKKDVEAEVKTFLDSLKRYKIKIEEEQKNGKSKVAAAPEVAGVKAPKDQTEDDTKSAPSRTLWILNASRSMNANHLKQHLGKFGKVATAKIVTDGERCFGYAVMRRSKDVHNCIKNLNGVKFNGIKIFLSPNRPTKFAISKAPVNQSMKKSEMCFRCDFNDKRRPVVSEELMLRRDYIREKQENERLRRRLIEEQRISYELRKRQQRNDERNRKFEFKLDQEVKKLQMEREVFEKERQDVLRLDKERLKLDKDKWKLLKEKSRLEKSILQAKNERKRKTLEPCESKTKVQKHERKRESSGERKRSHERNKYSLPRRYEDKDRYKDKPKIRVPSPPKLTVKNFAAGRKSEWDRKDKKQLTERKPSEKKIDCSRPPYFPEAKNHQERYDSSRAQWAANADYSAPWNANSEAGTATSVGRYHQPHFPPPPGPPGVPQANCTAPPGVEFSRFEHYGQVNFRNY